MDASLTGGLPVTLIGIGTVFSALLTLIVVINGLTRVLAAPAPRAAATAPPTPTREARTEAMPAVDATPDLLPVALAAYALHLQIRGRANAQPAVHGGTNQWALSGRMRQLTRLSR